MSEMNAAAAAKILEDAKGKGTLSELRAYVDKEVKLHASIGQNKFDMLHSPVYTVAAYDELIADLKKDGFGVEALVPGVSRITW